MDTGGSGENLDEIIATCVKKPPADAVENALQRWLAPSEPAPVTVLEPEHPLMQKFQSALNAYLIKENDRINTQIIDLKGSLKKSKHDYELQMSTEMYQLEQDVKHQRDLLKQFEENLENAVKYRESKEKELQLTREMHKEKMNILIQRKKEDMELQKDFDEYNWIWKQYEKRKNQTDCELAVSQRVSEKMTFEKKEKAQRQKDLDIMMYKLTTEVWNLESKISLIDEETLIKKSEMNAITTRIAESTADMDSLQVEHGRLMKAWMAVIKQIQTRDKVYNKLSDEYNELEVNFHIINAEIDGVKKQIAQSMQQHEELTIGKDRIQLELDNVMKLLRADEKKKADLELSMEETNAILELTEKDLNVAMMENTTITNSMKVVLRELEKLTEIKFKLENETLEKLQESLINDKASSVIATTIRKLKEEVKQLELGILTNENLQAKLLLQFEQQKDKNERTHKSLEDDEKLFALKDKELLKIEDNIKDTLAAIEKKQTLLENANKKLAALLEQLQGVEKSPMQRFVDELENNISLLTKQIKELQHEWVLIQSRVVNLSEQKQSVLSDINQKRKEIQLLEHKNLKLDSEINNLKKDRDTMQRSINSLQIRVEHLFKQRSEDHIYNDELEASYNHMTMEYVAQLKDAEEETINIEEEIRELENEKSQLEVTLHKTKREAMQWQKMVILTNETKQKVQEEKGAGGDVGKMKIEIHRMQVRQDQLTRLANRLADELAQGVVRREIAADKAAGDSKRKRLNIPYSIKEKKNNICKLRQEIDDKISAMETMQIQEKELQQLLNEYIMKISKAENNIVKLRIDIDELQDNKQKNLEHLVRIQHCAKMWSTIASGHNLPSGRLSEPKNELIKQIQLTRSLKTFIGHLITKPNLEDTQKRKLQGAFNTLKLNENLVPDNH